MRFPKFAPSYVYNHLHHFAPSSNTRSCKSLVAPEPAASSAERKKEQKLKNIKEQFQEVKHESWVEPLRHGHGDDYDSGDDEDADEDNDLKRTDSLGW